MTGPLVGVIANRILLALKDDESVTIAEMTKKQATDLVSEMLVAICQVDAGVTVKRTFDAFMLGFEE